MKIPEGAIHTVGKRKTARARVFLIPNSKFEISINNRTAEEFFPVQLYRDKVFEPFKVCGIDTSQFNYKIKIIVDGGGVNGQAEAIRHGISKALVQINEEYKPILRKWGFLTRDPRMVERKKYGRHKARRGHQFRKR